MKGLILGTSKGLDISQVYPWAHSAVKTGNRVVLISMEENAGLALQLRGIGVEVITKPVTLANRSPHNERFVLQKDYLMGCSEEYTVVTDVRDVVFQDNPISWMEQNLGNYKVVCSSEGLAYKDEPWGNHNLMEGYPNLYEAHKNNTIMNVGVLGGRSKDLANICSEIYTMCSTNRAYLSDQSSFNILCAKESMSSVIYKANSEEGFSLNCGTLVRNATGGSFRLNETTAHLLKEPEPIYDGKIFKTHNGKKYCIVHQWDRVPEYRP